MHPSLIPPRQVGIKDAALFLGMTPQGIRHYQEAGLLPEPGRGGDDRQYGYEDMIRLLWIQKMADAGISVDGIRDAFTDTAPAGTGGDRGVAVQALRTPEGRMGLLSDFVTRRLKSMPGGSLRQADLDILLVTERIVGPLGAAVQAARFIPVATHPGLREESDRVDAAEESLDDTVAVDDPRVAQVAADRHAFELMIHAAIEHSGLAQDDDELFDSWDALHPAVDSGDSDGRACGVGQGTMSLVEAVGKMPYDFSPARLRCMELTEELSAHEFRAS
jgi:DNA-binding transcriptional MerR regulator